MGLGWTGPFEIVRKLSDITYKIKKCSDGKLKIVHVDHLKLLNQKLESDEGQGVESEEGSDDRVGPRPKSPQFSRRGRRLKPKVICSP